MALSIPTKTVDLTDNVDMDAVPGIHPALDTPHLRALVHPERLLWSAAELRTLTTTVATLFRSELTEITRFASDYRWWSRLALNDGVELWLLTWLPGQGTEPHDHGGASGSFTVVRGDLHEEYRYPRRAIRAATRRTGTAIGFGAGRAHEVRNRGTVEAASVHAYSPPLVPTREYASLADIPDEIPPLPAGSVRIRDRERG
ncbi:MAG: cysteine dioxygenase [Streptosporangiales bacterium]|nr:cysteine dioxygenase [Streptosporangiales bacterium]